MLDNNVKGTIKFSKEFIAIIGAIITLIIFFSSFQARLAVIETELVQVRYGLSQITKERYDSRIAQLETKMMNLERRIENFER